MMVTFTHCEVGSAPKRLKKPPTMSLDQARIIKEIIVATVPPSMNGFLFPHDTLHLSLSMPTYGCTSVPVSGPAIQTRAIRDLLKPSDTKKGVPFESSTDQAICSPPMLIVNSIRYQILFVD